MAITSSSFQRLAKFEKECAFGTSGNAKNRKKRLGVRPNPSELFEKTLWDYDPELVIWYNRIWSRWMLFRRGHFVMTVKDEDRSYRQLDGRILTSLRKADAYTRGKRIFDEMLENNEKVVELDDRNFRDDVRYASKDLSRSFNKITGEDIGARNFPKEDIYVPDIETLEERRSRRSAGKNPNYFRESKNTKPFSPTGN
jgi:hypothetical protein